jgi:hypothetical protein
MAWASANTGDEVEGDDQCPALRWTSKLLTTALCIPNTPRAKQWVRDNLSPNHTKYDDASVIEHRYIGDIIDGIQADDLDIAMSKRRLPS